MPATVAVRRHWQILTSVTLLGAGLAAGCGSSPPQVPFVLGTADRNLTYCGSQSLDLYIPRTAAAHALPLAIYVHGGGIDRTPFIGPPTVRLAGAGLAISGRTPPG